MENENKPVQKGTNAWPLFLIGAAVGAALGVLIAPESGKESRRKLAEWIKERRAKGKEQFLTKKEQVEAALEAGMKAYKDGEKKMAGV